MSKGKELKELEQPELTVTQYLEGIIENLKQGSGYPRPFAGPSRAFAYGYAIGLLTKAKEEWDKRIQ